MRTTSKKPGKQRKYQFNVPMHESHKVISSHLSPELREEQGFRSLPVRVNDEVLIMRGKFKGIKGKINRINTKKQFVWVDKAVIKKTDNSEVPAKIHPSNLMIVKFGKHRDKARVEMINRRTTEEDAYLDPEEVIVEEDDVIDIDEDEFEEEDLEDEFDLVDDDEELAEEDDEDTVVTAEEDEEE